MIRISPSLASANQLQLLAEIRKAEVSAYTLHLDIEDGNYVPNISFGMRTVRQIREAATIPCSYHLMVKNPMEFLMQLPLEEGDKVFVHGDSSRYPSELLHIIGSRGAEAGLAFNPACPLHPLAYLFSRCASALILTSEPDGRGQIYLPAMEEKVALAQGMGMEEIWVDGGISLECLPALETYGATDAVLGRAFFQS